MRKPVFRVSDQVPHKFKEVEGLYSISHKFKEVEGLYSPYRENKGYREADLCLLRICKIRFSNDAAHKVI